MSVSRSSKTQAAAAATRYQEDINNDDDHDKQALSDPEGRRNYKKYGHPDGAQPWTFDLALPGWLRPGKDCSDGMLALYGVGYLVRWIFLTFAKGRRIA